MKKAFLLVALLVAVSLFLWRPASKYPHEFAICAMFKNEAPWLKEWIVFHHDVIGFDHFYLYNNDSTDNYKEVLKPFIDKGVVELIEWSSSDPSHRLGDDILWYPYQIGAYNDCLKNRALGKAKWVGIFDIDEFLVPVHGAASFRSYMRGLDKRRKGSVKFSWRIFGTSNVWDLGPDELLTEKMIYRAADHHDWHNWFKSMHRPEAVPHANIHDTPTLHAGYRKRHAKPEAFRLHHYWARTAKFCSEKRTTTKEDLLAELNQQEDRTMEQYLPTLKKALHKWDACYNE
ncbi:MAG TPA: glycosyltransferase family 92 protein [Chlamydiales bacterium]|nr:glycosyltransferase family 92 protein [Chlamydiales bacterium]